MIWTDATRPKTLSTPFSNVPRVTVSPKSFITESPWLMSIQIGWEAQIYNSKLPYWMRVYAVAMGRSDPNLHTPLEPGELAKLLGHKQPDGSIQPLDRRDLHKYVKRAVDLQLLDEASSLRCLVLPAATIACRRPGFRKSCAHHSGAASKAKKPIAIRQATSAPVNRVNNAFTPSQVTGLAVGQETRPRRAENPPTPGSRAIFAVEPRHPAGVRA